MRSSNLFFFLGRINTAFRSFILGSVFSVYILILYYFDIGIKFTLTNLSYTFVIPLIISSVIFLVIPKKSDHGYIKTEPDIEKQNNPSPENFFDKGSQKKKTDSSHVQNHSAASAAQQSKGNNTKNQSPDVQEMATVSDPHLKEKVEDLKKSVFDIKKKVDDFEKQFHDMKVNLQDLKRTGVIKNDTYESALKELKAFQAELDNPFNFISKYFEMLNVPGMYDLKKNGTSIPEPKAELQEQPHAYSEKGTDPNQKPPLITKDKPNKIHSNRKPNHAKNKQPVHSQFPNKSGISTESPDLSGSDYKNQKDSEKKTDRKVHRPKGVKVVG